MLISIDGKIIDPQRIFVLATDKAFLYGLAVFETMRTYNKKVFRLNEHIRRLYKSAAILNLQPKWDLKKTHKIASDIIGKSKYKEERIRVILTENHLIIMIEELKAKPVSFYKNGVKLASYLGRRGIPYAKVFGDPFCYLANQYAHKKRAYDSVLTDPDTSYIRECSYANIFWVQNNKLYTTDKNILYGITRDTVIELFGGCGFADIKLKSLLRADEVFITQTSGGILPVFTIDGRKIGNGKPGIITQRLMREFDALAWGK